MLHLQVLVELDSALLDDQPHWYKLQLHDVSSLPLPNASPYLQRRVLHPEDTLSSRRLQSKTRARTHMLARTHTLPFTVFILCFLLIPCVSPPFSPDKGPFYNPGNNTCSSSRGSSLLFQGLGGSGLV